MRRLRNPLLIASVPLAALAALGGAYSSSVLPLLIAAAVAFLAASPPVLTRGVRVQDACLLAFLLGLVLQLTPLPPAVVDALSPEARTVAGVLLLVPPEAASATISLRAASTRETLSSAAAVVLVFWAARGLLRSGGARTVARVISVAGFAVALTGLAQRATAARTLMWLWRPEDPTALPLGPFVNRNHFAMWLVMASALVAGALATHLAHRHAAGADRYRSSVVRWLDDGTMLWLGGATALIWLTVMASGSRGGMLAVAVFNATWLALAAGRTGSRRTLGYAAAAVAVVGIVGVWANAETIAGRLGSGDAVARTTVWRDTLPVIRDFWLAGTGGGTYASVMVLYQQAARFVIFNEAQNEYLQLVAEGGLLLSVPLLGWLIAWGATSARRLREDRSAMFWLRTAALAGLAAVASQCLWDSALRMPANALLAAVLAAIVVHEKPPAPAGRTSPSVPGEAVD
ncbi:MAG: O-antigen ligase family protein [Vicinamibacterales bacterium]